MKKDIKLPSLIAEIGCNFVGDLNRAKMLSELAIKSGADYLKYQFFTGKNLINEKYYSQVLQTNGKNVIQAIDKIQLSQTDYEKLFVFNEENGYPWGTSFFSYDDAVVFFEKFSFSKLKTFSFIKIASGETTDFVLLDYLSKLNKELKLPIIISTGISTDKEIKKTISFFKNQSSIYLLHCIVEYPVKTVSLNLNRIKYLRKKFNLISGFSDHSLSITPTVLSIFLGAEIIEKHFTDNRNNIEADNPMSMLPDEFLEIKYYMNNLDKIKGDGKLIISEKEFKELTYARKGLYAKNKINKGDIIKKDNIISQRPNLGYNDAKNYFKIVNKKAIKDIEENEPITLSDIN